MTTPTFFSEFLIVLIIATVVAVIFERIRIPAILGYLLSGVVIGPYGLGIIADLKTIHVLAELGVILLMLTIGLEFSIDRLKGLRNLAIFGGSLQILLSIVIGLLFAWWKGWSAYEGFFLGSVIALSSTAIVFKFLIDRGELDTQYGRIAVSILIFQDLAVVPLLILTTSLGQPADSILVTLSFAFLKAFILITGVFVFARFILPYFLHQIALSRNREIFFLTAIVICLGTAWISGQLGFSLAIGAFLAGFMFANTDYGYQLTGEIVPFRHLFVSIFFVSIGLLFDVSFANENILLIATVVGLVLIANFVVVSGIVVLFRYPPRFALASGIILSQIGEFSFLLIEAARHAGGIQPFHYQILLSTAFTTMLITPFLFHLATVLLKISEHIPIFGLPPSDWKSAHEAEKSESGHIILCGFGPSGKDLAMTFQQEKIPFILLEINPVHIKEARSLNMHVIYGDAANEEVMKRAGIAQARVIVISIGDPIGLMQIIRVVQRLNPKTTLVVRSRFERDVARLYELGADHVIMEELEASSELNRVILEHFEVSPERIERHLERIRFRKELVIEKAIMRQHLDNKES